jgi:hypothetical protein
MIASPAAALMAGQVIALFSGFCKLFRVIRGGDPPDSLSLSQPNSLPRPASLAKSGFAERKQARYL